jgi:hypothetical protein
MMELFFENPNLPPSNFVNHHKSLFRVAYGVGVGQNTIFFHQPLPCTNDPIPNAKFIINLVIVTHHPV